MTEKKSHSNTEAKAEVEELSQASDSESRAHARGGESTPVYEVGFHVVPTVGDEGVTAVVQTVRKALGDAEIINEKFPERMTLAYTIERSVEGKVEKYQEAYFGFIKFATQKEAIPGIQAALRAEPHILRYIVVTTVREETPSPRRAVFTSTHLEGETIKKPEGPVEKKADVSEEELDKSIDALVAQE